MSWPEDRREGMDDERDEAPEPELEDHSGGRAAGDTSSGRDSVARGGSDAR